MLNNLTIPSAMLHIKRVVDIMIDGSANDNCRTIVLDPLGWLHFIREAALPADADESVRYRGFLITTNGQATIGALAA
jgi:hypothetical protein